MEDPKVARDRASETTFFDLPQELIWKMLYYLPPRDTVHFCETYRGAAIICQDNYFWLQKIRRDFGVVFERELTVKGIPAENRVETYKQYWKDVPRKLLLCAEGGKAECVESLLHIGVNPNFINMWGETALIWSSGEGHVDVVRLLLEYDADPNLQEKNGETALMFASERGRADIVRLLLDYNADPNIKNEFGSTALGSALSWGRMDVVRVLLEHGADPNIKDNDGNTALELAGERGDVDGVVLLLEYGADPLL